MAEYRAYILGADRRIMEAVNLDCPDDDAAKQTAMQLVEDHDVELWQGARKVETLKHKPDH
jgi:hypothetical protein